MGRAGVDEVGRCEVDWGEVSRVFNGPSLSSEAWAFQSARCVTRDAAVRSFNADPV